METSSIRKGESLIDTAMTLNAMHPDILVIRHSLSGVPYLLADKVNCGVINAGDGQHEHPTQALLDALVIRRRKNKILRNRNRTYKKLEAQTPILYWRAGPSFEKCPCRKAKIKKNSQRLLPGIVYNIIYCLIFKFSAFFRPF